MVRTFLTAGLVSTWMVACSSEPEAPVPFPDAESFCLARAEGECGGPEGAAARCAAPLDRCVGARLSACRAEVHTANLSARRYDPKRAEVCVEKSKSVYQAGLLRLRDLVGAESMSADCQRVFRGTTPKNAVCQTDFDCAENRVCAVVRPGEGTRVCADAVVKKELDFCADPGSVCADGTYCATDTGGAPQCVKFKLRGEKCSANGSCGTDLRCGEAGFCEARLPGGAACRGHDDCAKEAPYCDDSTELRACAAGRSFAPNAPGCVGFGK